MSGICLHGNFGKLKKSAVVSLAMASAVFSAYAEEIVYSEWNPEGSGNWSDATRWIDGIVPPAVDGNVRIVRSEAYATDDDYDILNNLFRLRFRWKSSLDLRFDRDHYDFAPNSIEEITDNVQNDSTLIKSGKGRLVWIDGFERILMDRLVVTNGVLELRDADGMLKLKDANRAVMLGARGDGLLAFNGNEDGSMLYISGLEGDGVVTNMRPSVRVMFTGGTAEKPNVFSGTVTKSFEPEFDYGCYQDFTGMSSESCSVRMYDGSVGLRVIGMAGESGSLGSANGFWFHGDSELRYLGSGETTDKKMNMGPKCASFTFDGGAGGLTLAGQWGATENPYILPITLTGTNTENACVLKSGFLGNATNGFNLVKKGSGIWRLDEGGARDIVGTLTVEDGTLEYVSVSERGTDSSIGTGDFLSAPVRSLKANAAEVPWSVMLGTHSTTGRFVYAGTEDVCCTSRLFAVCGHGAVSSKTDAALGFKGAYSPDAAGGNLILDGSGVYDSFTDVTNGVGAMSVTKTGSGTWTLSGDVKLDGGIDVQGGVLHICNATNYTWFRFTVEDTWGNTFWLQLSQLGFYDANGEQQNLDLVDATSVAGTAAYKLPEGSVTWEHDFVYDKERSVTNLFKGTTGLMTAGREGNPRIVSTDPEAWMSMVVRLPAGSSRVEYYDVQSQQGRDASTGEMYIREPEIWNLEGSVDGRNWLPIDRKSGLTVSKAGKRWYSCDAENHDEDHRGFKISGGKPESEVSIASIAVSGGGKAVVDLPVTVSDVRVDTASGGTVDGFRFATDGTLSVNGISGSLVDIPVAFENVTGLENLSGWTLMSDGEIVRKYFIRVSDGKVSLARHGMTVSIR